MKILCYANLENGIDRDLQEKIEKIARQDRTELFYELEAFSRRIEKADPTTTIAVICPGDQKEYDEIMIRHQKLLNMFVILVQPDQEPIACLHQPYGNSTTYGRTDKIPPLRVSAL